jgi:hypothetical protein
LKHYWTQSPLAPLYASKFQVSPVQGVNLCVQGFQRIVINEQVVCGLSALLGCGLGFADGVKGRS